MFGSDGVGAVYSLQLVLWSKAAQPQSTGCSTGHFVDRNLLPASTHKGKCMTFLGCVAQRHKGLRLHFVTAQILLLIFFLLPFLANMLFRAVGLRGIKDPVDQKSNLLCHQTSYIHLHDLASIRRRKGRRGVIGGKERG